MENDTDIAELVTELRALNTHPFMRRHANKWRLIGSQFVRGLAFGFGSVLGATLMVALFVYLLGQIDFIPIIGDWATEILKIIQAQGQ